MTSHAIRLSPHRETLSLFRRPSNSLLNEEIESGTSAEPLGFATRVQNIKEGAAYQNLGAVGQLRVRKILDRAEFDPQQSYIMEYLELLLATPDAPAHKPSVSTKAHSKTSETYVESTEVRQLEKLRQYLQNVAEEYDELAPELRIDFEDREENATGRVWEKVAVPESNASFLLDRRDPKDIHIRIEISLLGTEKSVRMVRAMEDAAEKAVSTTGFTVDINYVDYCSEDTVTIQSDPSSWPTAKNWVGGPQTIAHELLHVFGLPDEYNYIESHADNEHMLMKTRLYWFLVQLDKIDPTDAKRSIMGNGKEIMLRHICGAAQLPIESCTRARAGISLRGESCSA